MIAWIKGVLREKRPPFLLLDVRGVGYELEAPMTTFYTLPELGQEIALYTHQVVREDSHQLFGFAAQRDRDVFRMLLRVNGVGAKLALAILSGMDVPTFGRCIFEADAASLSRLPGVGKKTAERLIIEMRDRLRSLPSSPAADRPLAGAAPAPAADPAAEAVDALVALGLKAPEASRRVQDVAGKGMACEEIVRLALQAMVK